jgi:FkbH-like protein
MDVYESGFGQYRQELLDPESGLHAFGPDLVLLAVEAHEVRFPMLSDDPDELVRAELERWAALWEHAAAAGAAVVQHNFVVPPDVPFGHLANSIDGSRHRMFQELNLALGARLPAGSHVLDCERLAGQFGKDRWFDPRYWDRAKLAVSLPALPILARHAAAILLAHVGLSRKCLVVDLDNTLWGGVVADVGVDDILLGPGDPVGEAHAELQEYLVELRRRGVILAACSKNDEETARAPFECHPHMRIRIDDFAVFVANWQSKVDNLEHIASDLGLDLDGFVYLDDNPAERAAIRRLLPQVDVIALPEQPSLYARTLAAYPYFESSSFTSDDARRTDQYRARAVVERQARSAESIDEFYRSLDMSAEVSGLVEADLPRVAQLVNKTNQFNLTTRRVDIAELRGITHDPDQVHCALRLRDRFVDHGLVGVMVGGRRDERVCDIDIFLLSCRVIGRTAESVLMHAFCERARSRGYRWVRGRYLPTEKNGLVRDLFPRMGFAPEHSSETETTWLFELGDELPEESPFIEVALEAGVVR